jgi:hypothetical protein
MGNTFLQNIYSTQYSKENNLENTWVDGKGSAFFSNSLNYVVEKNNPAIIWRKECMGRHLELEIRVVI